MERETYLWKRNDGENIEISITSGNEQTEQKTQHDSATKYKQLYPICKTKECRLFQYDDKKV